MIAESARRSDLFRKDLEGNNLDERPSPASLLAGLERFYQ